MDIMCFLFFFNCFDFFSVSSVLCSKTDDQYQIKMCKVCNNHHKTVKHFRIWMKLKCNKILRFAPHMEHSSNKAFTVHIENASLHFVFENDLRNLLTVYWFQFIYSFYISREADTVNRLEKSLLKSFVSIITQQNIRKLMCEWLLDNNYLCIIYFKSLDEQISCWIFNK